MALLLGLMLWLLPRTYYVSRTITVAVERQAVFDTLADLRTWPRWAVWYSGLDPTLSLSFSEPSTGPGAQVRFFGEHLGAGRMAIVGDDPGRELTIEVHLAKGHRAALHRFVLETEPGDTRIVWSILGDAGDALFANLTSGTRERTTVRDVDRSLRALKACLELGPCAATP